MSWEEVETLSNEIFEIETAREQIAAEMRVSSWEREKELIEEDYVLYMRWYRLTNLLSSLLGIKVSTRAF